MTASGYRTLLTMTQLSYEADQRRLRVEGACRDGDAVRDAVEAFGGLAGELTVDLTGASEISYEVAAILLEARDAAREEGRRIHLVRKAGSDVDVTLEEARGSSHPGEDG